MTTIDANNKPSAAVDTSNVIVDLRLKLTRDLHLKMTRLSGRIMA